MNRDHIVRPRWVWGGLVLALLGACLLALWIATWWSGAGISGLVLLVLGGAAAERGGILYDTQGSRPGSGEAAEVRDAHARRGTAPGDMIIDDRLRQEARESSRMTDALLHAAEDHPRPAFDKLGAGMLLGGAAFLLFAQALYPHTHLGQDNALRTLLLAAVTALAGFRILLGQRPGPAASALAALCGIALILLAMLTDHDGSATVILEIATGAWIVLASFMTLDHPRDSTPARRLPAVGRTQAPRTQVPRSLARGRTAQAHPDGPAARSDNVRVAGVAMVIGAAVLWSAHAARRLAHRG